jgi:APA family basic amino acid/polyamine antiporter
VAVTPPRRQLGLSITAAIVIANMIGTGVFASTGFQAQGLHDPKTILLTWIVGGVLAMCGAATYAELGSMWPKAGGEYVYLREAYHPAVGFMSGWVSLTAGFSAPIAVSALAFATYLARLVPGLESTAPWLNASLDIGHHHIFTFVLGSKQAVAIGLILALTFMHSFDAKLGGWVQAGFTAAKVLLIVGFIIGGLAVGHGDWHNFETQHGGFANVFTPQFAVMLMYVVFAYSGWNAAAYVAGEVERPARTLPRALLAGTGAVLVLYLLLNVVFLYAVPTDVLAGPPKGMPVIEVGDTAARALFGDAAGNFVTSVIALALVSAVSAMVMAGPRVYAAMAEDHALPHQLGRYNKRGVPTIAVVTQGILGTLFVLVGDLGALVRFASFTLTLSAALTVASIFVMRHRRIASPYRTFGYPVTPILFLMVSAWIAYAQIKENPLESLVVAGVLAVGGVLYALFGRKHITKPDTAAPLPEARVVDRDAG